MSIPVQCPACQHAFAVADRFAGKKGKCPHCGGVFRAEAKPAEEIGVFPEAEPDVFPEVPASAAPTLSAPVGGTGKPLKRATPLGVAALSDSGPVETFPMVPHVSTAVSVPTRTHLHSHRKSSPLPLIIGGSVAGLAVLGMVIGVVWSLGGTPATNVETQKQDDRTSEVASNVEQSPTPAPPPTPPAPAIDVAALKRLESSVLAIEIKTPNGASKATCVLVAERGFAVTPAHGLTTATSVEAITADDIRIPVSGVAAIDVAHDLAIIKLEPTLPIPLTPIPIHSGDVPSSSDIAGIAASHEPTRVVAGKYKSADAFAKLSPTMRSKLKGAFSDWADDTTIVMHGVTLTSASVGAPLVTPEGRLVAIHVAGDASGGLAIHAKHITPLLESAGSDIKPFGAPMVAANEATPANESTPSPMDLKPLPPPMSDTPDDPIDALIARIEEHRQECEKKKWTAADATDYAQFQLFARFVHEAATGADMEDAPEPVKQKLADAVRLSLFGLTADNWPDEVAWKQTNEQAVKGFDAPGQGVFLLAQITIATSQGNMLGDVPLAVAEIVGQSKMIALPLKEGGEKLGVGDRLLVLGLHDPTSIIKLNNIDVPLVRTKYVISVAKQDEP